MESKYLLLLFLERPRHNGGCEDIETLRNVEVKPQLPATRPPWTRALKVVMKLPALLIENK